ncbi:hypothetical protein L1887_49703 [Cichorium endivia]|nr:hypothetical protein L1887_49703 [Cichorium endivia]
MVDVDHTGVDVEEGGQPGIEPGTSVNLVRPPEGGNALRQHNKPLYDWPASCLRESLMPIYMYCLRVDRLRGLAQETEKTRGETMPARNKRCGLSRLQLPRMRAGRKTRMRGEGGSMGIRIATFHAACASPDS